MMGEKRNNEPMFYYTTIEKLVPQDHYLRVVNSTIDFSFIRPMVKHLYSHTGKPSIDPEMLIRMLLIGYLYNVPSERRLEQEIQVNLAYRWFLGLTLDESPPDHSTISQNRRRRFREDDTFQKIFDSIVEQCITKGLVCGHYLATDSTHIKANASIKSLEPILLEREPKEYLRLLEGNCELSESDNVHTITSDSSSKNDKISNDTHTSKTDPDAKLMTRPNKPKGLHYLNHITIDSTAHIITDVHITPGNVNDHEPYLERLKRQIEQFDLCIDAVTADKAYGRSSVYHELAQMDIDPYIPRQKYGGHKEMYPQDRFTYDHDTDSYLCPQGHALTRKGFSKSNAAYFYKSNKRKCSLCPDKPRCTTSKKGVRTIYRHLHQEEIEHALSNLKRSKAKEMVCFRKHVERIIAESKGFHGMARARLRGISNVKEQCLMTAVVQNIKRMVAWEKKKPRPAHALRIKRTHKIHFYKKLIQQLLNLNCYNYVPV